MVRQVPLTDAHLMLYYIYPLWGNLNKGFDNGRTDFLANLSFGIIKFFSRLFKNGSLCFIDVSQKYL